MTAAEKALRKWLDVLALHAWEVMLIEVDAERLGGDKCIAQVERSFPEMGATVTVATKHPAAEIEASVRHECLHLVACELAAWAYCVTDRMGPEAARLAQDIFDGIEERMVRALERAFDRCDETGGAKP